MPVPLVNPQLKPWRNWDQTEIDYVTNVARRVALGTAPSSGFLAGRMDGGPLVQRLEEQWANTFHVKHAVSFNSGTSALLAACRACGIGPGKTVMVPALSMSATAAMPAFLGAELVWADVNPHTLNAEPNDAHADAVLVTNLFGRAADYDAWGKYVGPHRIPLIEDNCQAPFAKWNGEYTGTIGDIGVFSLNVHKHMQTGEGGIAVTDDEELAQKMRMFRNHGEVAPYPYPDAGIGLNLRMTEMTAALALSQLAKGQTAVNRTMAIAQALIEQLANVQEIEVPPPYTGQENVFYALPILFRDRGRRDACCRALQEEGVPITAGYGAGPLNNIPALRNRTADKGQTPNAAAADARLGIIELCAWDFPAQAITQIGDAFRSVCQK